jgi:hypothetical protein
MIAEYLLEKALDAVIERTKGLLADTKSRLKSNQMDIHEALSNHLISTSNWCSEVSFNDLRFLLNQIFSFIQEESGWI